jgi:hypothetical protein
VQVFFRLGIVAPVAAASVQSARSEEAVPQHQQNAAAKDARRHLVTSGVAVGSTTSCRVAIYQYKVCANSRRLEKSSDCQLDIQRDR